MLLAADPFIHVNVGDLDITLVQISTVLSIIGGVITAIWNKTINYLRDRDQREALLRQQMFEMAIATAHAEEKAAESVKSLADKVVKA